VSPFLLTPPSDDPLGGDLITVRYNFQWYKFVAYAVRQIIPAQLWDSPPADIGDQVDTLVELLGTPMPITYPDRVLLLPPAAKIVTGNAMTFSTVAANPFGGVWFQNTAAINDEFEFQFMLNGGSYHMLTHGRTANNHGRVDWKMDGSSFSTLDDFYSASTVENVERSTAVTIVGDGLHTLNAKVASKFASSSNYFHQFNYILIKP
jgi:hypothetical protein